MDLTRILETMRKNQPWPFLAIVGGLGIGCISLAQVVRSYQDQPQYVPRHLANNATVLAQWTDNGKVHQRITHHDENSRVGYFTGTPNCFVEVIYESNGTKEKHFLVSSEPKEVFVEYSRQKSPNRD